MKGANATPIWTDPDPLTCTSCHGMPPVGHVPVAAPPTAAGCATCHPTALNTDGSLNLVDGGHLNGKADVADIWDVPAATATPAASRTSRAPTWTSRPLHRSRLPARRPTPPAPTKGT